MNEKETEVDEQEKDSQKKLIYYLMRFNIFYENICHLNEFQICF